MSKSKSKQRNGREEKYINHQQERKKTEDSTQGEYILQARKERGGSVAPRRNSKRTESATKESRDPTRKAKKAIQETNGNSQDKCTKRTQNEQGRATRRKTSGRGKKKKKKRKKEKENGKGKVCQLS